MVLWAKQAMAGSAETPALTEMAYEVAREWTDVVVNLLRLQTSDKNVFTPPGPAADAALRGCQRHYCTASIDAHGIDLGVDTVAGGDRDNPKLKARAEDNKGRAERGNVVVKTLRSVGRPSATSRKPLAYPAKAWPNPAPTGPPPLAPTPR